MPPRDRRAAAGDSYSAQDRGSADAYAAYFAGMNKTMQQKVAFTTAHFPAAGTVADMGSGSGQGSFDLASLQPGLQVVGVDINPTSVELSRRTHRRPNLSFREGNIAGAVFAPRSVDAILDSSVLHHVTSFNGFDVAHVERCLDNQVASLKPGGVLIIRDFVVPAGPETVHLDLPAGDVAPLFERFAREFRSSRNLDGPVPHREVACDRPGFRRFELTLRAAAEFVLRKDYRDDWETEIQEEYLYMTQAQFEAAFRRRGLRVVTSQEIRNPWIVAHRFEGKVFFADVDGRPLGYPPTNFLIVGEKVAADGGVALRETAAAEAEPRFLRLRAFRRPSGAIMELVERPNTTLDLLPYFERDGRLLVAAKQGFPRPILNAEGRSPNLDRTHISGFVAEPITGIVADPLAGEESARVVLAERAGIAAESVRAVGRAFSYYPSPGGIAERVAARLVEIDPEAARNLAAGRNYTAFSGPGRVQALDAAQVLRGHQVGGMFETRLEIGVYELLLTLGRSAGPWIGAAIELRDQNAKLVPRPAREALSPAARAAFEPVDGHRPEFLSVRRGRFVEVDARGVELHVAELEYVEPKHLSRNTASALPVMRVGGEVFVGLEERDLPAPQVFTGSSALMTAPAFRLRQDVEDLDAVGAVLRVRLAGEFGVTPTRLWPLGGRYFPTSGATPEVVYPYAVEVDSAGLLTWVKLADLIAARDDVHDAHLRVAALRLAHAVDLLA